MSQLVRAETPASLPPAELTDAQFAFVSSFEGRALWISRLPWEGPRVRSRPQWLRDHAAFAKVTEQSLPDALRALHRQAVSLYDAEGKKLCQANLERWGVLADYDSGNDEWVGLSKPALLKRMFASESDARRRYAAELALPASCTRAVWARATSLPPAAAFKVTALSGKALLAERARFRSTPEWADAQKRFAEEHKRKWDEHADTNVHAYSCDVKGERFLLATLFQWSDCESFSADLVLMFRGRGKQAVQLPNDLSVEVEPHLALDLNLDGLPEWLTSDQLIGWDGERFSPLVDNASLWSSCPC